MEKNGHVNDVHGSRADFLFVTPDHGKAGMSERVSRCHVYLRARLIQENLKASLLVLFTTQV